VIDAFATSNGKLLSHAAQTFGVETGVGTGPGSGAGSGDTLGSMYCAKNFDSWQPKVVELPPAKKPSDEAASTLMSEAPVPRADHELPFHFAMWFAGLPPAV
jgi:hypothetical protein